MQAQSTAFREIGSGTYLAREANAHEFVPWHPMLRGAPLKAVGNKICDKPRAGERMAAIVVARPAGAPTRPGAKKQNRSTNDKKTLTKFGQEALLRRHRGSKQHRAPLYSGSQVLVCPCPRPPASCSC